MPPLVNKNIDFVAKRMVEVRKDPHRLLFTPKELSASSLKSMISALETAQSVLTTRDLIFSNKDKAHGNPMINTGENG